MKSVSLWQMRTIETIEEFYTRKFGGIPADIRKEIGHFNVFKLDPFVGDNAKPVRYARRDYFKIMLVTGNYNMHYADGIAEIQKQALVFTNPQIPYSCEYTDRIVSGFFCLFTPEFFHQFGNLDQYAVFQPGGTHVFELNDEQVSKITAIYKSMFEEIGSDYMHKYDVLVAQLRYSQYVNRARSRIVFVVYILCKARNKYNPRCSIRLRWSSWYRRIIFTGG